MTSLGLERIITRSNRSPNKPLFFCIQYIYLIYSQFNITTEIFIHFLIYVYFHEYFTTKLTRRKSHRGF